MLAILIYHRLIGKKITSIASLKTAVSEAQLTPAYFPWGRTAWPPPATVLLVTSFLLPHRADSNSHCRSIPQTDFPLPQQATDCQVKSLTRENVTSWNYRLQPSSRKQACDVIWRRRSKSRCDFWLMKTRNLKLLGQEAERLQNYKWKHLLSICRSKSQIRHKWYVFTYTDIYIYLE